MNTSNNNKNAHTNNLYGRWWCAHCMRECIRCWLWVSVFLIFFSFHFIGFHLVDSQIHTRKKNWISSTQTTAHNNRNYISSEAKRARWWRTKYTTSKNVSIEWARTCLISVKVSNSFRNLSRICKSRNYCFNEANNHDHPT